MPYDFPRQMTGDTGADVKALWETLWKLVEALNLNDEAVRAALARLEAQWNTQS